jgi:hypothetical protein
MSKPENRQHPRVALSVPVMFSILVPEDTFRPVLNEATLLDLSEKGAMVLVELDEEVYRSLLRKTRYCRIELSGHAELPEKLVGKAVWIQPERTSGRNTYRIGMFFEDMPDPLVGRLRSYLARLTPKPDAS